MFVVVNAGPDCVGSSSAGASVHLQLRRTILDIRCIALAPVHATIYDDEQQSCKNVAQNSYFEQFDKSESLVKFRMTFLLQHIT
jgi:hypothetical protein